MRASLRTVLFGFLMAGLIGATARFAAAEAPVRAPDFTLKSDSGKNIKLSELRGQVVLVNFWATWCAP